MAQGKETKGVFSIKLDKCGKISANKSMSQRTLGVAQWLMACGDDWIDLILMCLRVVAAIVSRFLVQDGHKAGLGFAIFLGKSCPETEVDRCPEISQRTYGVQILAYTEIPKPSRWRTILWPPDKFCPYFKKWLTSFM